MKNRAFEAASLAIRVQSTPPLPSLPDRDVCRAIREEAGVPRELAAMAIGVHPMTLYAWERGAHLPNRYSLRPYLRLLAVLRADVNEMAA